MTWVAFESLLPSVGIVVSQVPPDYLKMRVTVRPQGSMRLYGRRDLPLVEARMAASATAEIREDASMVSCPVAVDYQGRVRLFPWHSVSYFVNKLQHDVQCRNISFSLVKEKMQHARRSLLDVAVTNQFSTTSPTKCATNCSSRTRIVIPNNQGEMSNSIYHRTSYPALLHELEFVSTTKKYSLNMSPIFRFQ